MLSSGQMTLILTNFKKSFVIFLPGKCIHRFLDISCSSFGCEFVKNKIAQGNEIAAPSILTLAPIGNTMLAKVWETSPFSVTLAIDTGKVTAYK